MIEEPADAVSRRLILERFYTENVNTISDLRMSRADELYFVFVKGNGYCERGACLTVVFDPNDPGRLASFLSNGQFFISENYSGRLGGRWSIVFSPELPGELRVAGELTVAVMPRSLILIGK